MEYGRILWKRPYDGQWIKGPTIPLKNANEFCKYAQQNYKDIEHKVEKVTKLTSDDYLSTQKYLDTIDSGVELLIKVPLSDFKNVDYLQTTFDSYDKFISSMTNILQYNKLLSQMNNINLKLSQ